jgi:hypothetical protein
MMITAAAKQKLFMAGEAFLQTTHITTSPVLFCVRHPEYPAGTGFQEVRSEVVFDFVLA